MAKYLTDISISLKYNKKIIDVETAKKFNVSAQTVNNIFWYLIPKRFEFGNIMKLIIEICLNKDEYEEPTNFGGYVTYNFNGFDFQEYFTLSRIDQNKKILNVLRKIIRKIPVEKEENKKIALEITNQIETMNFDLKHVSQKLSKTHKSRKFKANIIYRVNDNGQNSYLEIIDKEGNKIVNEFLIKNNIYEFNHKLKKTRWKDDTFEIIDKDGNIFKKFKIKKTLPTTMHTRQ